MTQYDIAILGGGPGGYVCALRAAKLGLSVALIDEREALGGTCLNIGCIPSKALLHSTEGHGAAAPEALGDMMRRKEAVVAKLAGGIALMMKQAKVRVLVGRGRLLGGGKIAVEGRDAGEIEARTIVLATGSRPVELPALPFDGQVVVSSTEALAFDKVPERLAVVGAGAIGLELGSVWSRLGSKVTFVEFLPQIAPTFDADISTYAQRLFTRQGMEFHLGAKVTGARVEGGAALLDVDKGEEKLEIAADKVLVCVGRSPASSGLGLEAAGVTTDAKGRVVVDAQLRTGAAGVWALGDLVNGPMLAHKAEAEGRAVAERLAGRVALPVEADLVPGVVYTSPEIASVGIGERGAKERGLSVRVGKAYFAANGRAVACGAPDGYAKLVCAAEGGRVLGVQIVGPSASELIAAAAAHMQYGALAEDVALTVQAHPTLSEVLREAAENAMR